MVKIPVSVQEVKNLSSESKEEMLSKIEKEAKETEVEYWGCSQAVLRTLQRHFKIGNGDVFKAASPFAGGVGRLREACGALIGGVMAIGLAYGRDKYETGKVAMEQAEFNEALVRANKFGEKFKERFGSLRCGDVKLSVRGIEYDEHSRINTVEGFEDHAKCGDVTGPAARFAAEVMLQPTELFADEINSFTEDLREVRKQQKR